MPLGPGKYGRNAEALLKQFGGTLAVVILYGTKGAGFDVAVTDPQELRALPTILRDLADSIERDLPREIKRATES